MCLMGVYRIFVNRKTTVLISFIKTFPILKTQLFLVPTRCITNESYHQTPSDQYKYNDIIASNKLITNYIRSGDLGSAIQVFESMAVKNTVTWNSILAGYARKSGEVLDARKLFDRIPEPDNFSCNTMLACYVNSSDMNAAWIFFNEMHVRDIASWNTMISGFSRNGMMGEAYQMFSVMPERNDITWNAMISGYAESGDMESAVKLFEIAPAKSVVAWTAMVSGYLKLGRVELAEQVFSEMPIKNVVTWNSMIAGYVENHRSEDALKLFRHMMESGIRPNSSSMSSVLLGCSELSSLKLGKQVHQLLCRSPLYSDTTIGTSLISMYCKCGELEDALKVFHEISKKDVVTWNAMISGYAQYGQGDKALNLFDKMQNHGLKPNWITFVGLLSACNHAGLVDIGLHLFYTMQSNYRIAAKPDHYTCVVDLLGRAGKLDEAVDLVKNMPFIPHPAVYGIILGACRIHKNLEAAEFAAKNLLDCEPSTSTGYIQLANVYAAMNKWDHVSMIRRLMKNNNVVKVPGYSWIEVNNAVHKFRSGDRLHPELTSIHEKLDELEKKLKAAGYLPNFEFALHNLNEEQKKQMLLWHSEKLAIAYGLIKLPVGVPVRLFKNLRVCGDCHEATKFISRIETREIIVRDTTRFHHFKNGTCSCGDYW